jgi:uncharacterized protein (DUF1499 family)
MTAVVFASLAAALLVAGPLGTRVGVWSFLVGFACLAVSVLLGVVSVVLALVSGWRTHRWPLALAAALIAAIPIGALVVTLLAARGKPPIHDITTDTEDVPPFVAVLPLRGGVAGAKAAGIRDVSPAGYDGPSAAAQQRRAYPDVQPLVTSATPSQAFDAVLALARERGWNVVAEDRAAGRIEAIDTTLWFGFKDDVVIRVRPQESGSRVDMRSKSRVGVGDLGANARRIGVFLSDLRDRVSDHRR